MEAAKLIIEVVAGILPGEPMPEHSRRWTWTSSDQDALAAGDKEAQAKYIRINGESREYAASLAQPATIELGSPGLALALNAGCASGKRHFPGRCDL